MREHYSYEIATITAAGLWRTAVFNAGTFIQDPKSIARSLLEQWINTHQGRLPGGRVFVYAGQGPDDDQLVATVRVQVFRGDLQTRAPQPAAVAYLGEPARDYPRARPAERDPHSAGPPHRLSRVRSWLKMPPPRKGDDEIDDLPVRIGVLEGQAGHPARRPGTASHPA